ncbi:phospholipase D-like domain-containing protein [Rhodophyticola sp.]|jgi:competence protein ComEA|uniref:phospholipase D-like domain-containing protein n=1 Tax=Rhodophyticola sp. TaxID=2680032 RepID=UPI003D2B7CAE
MFRIDWHDVTTKDVLDGLRQIAGAPEGAAARDDLLRPVVAGILAHVGGLPVTGQPWSGADCTAAARLLLAEAVAGFLRRGHGHGTDLPGCDLGPAAGMLERTLTARARVEVNHADADTLAALPVIGPATAARILNDRRARGPFSSASELAERVSGIGPAGAERLNLMLSFDGPLVSGGRVSGDLDADLPRLLALSPEPDPARRLARMLEAVAGFVAADPHPATVAGRPRDDLPVGDTTPLPQMQACDQIEVLEDGAYYLRLQTLLEEARNRIDVAMFFMAFPGPTHPTRALLERLASAHDTGVAVRVLLDRDREDDPYRSRVINAEAAGFLKSRGVPVRIDPEEVLMHSKTVAIDRRLAVVGSHNWTAGSYFRYRDMSVAITSQEVATALHDRFDGLWALGTDA